MLIDGPQEITGVHRQVITTRRVTLTPVVATGLKHNASQKSLKKAWTVSYFKLSSTLSTCYKPYASANLTIWCN
ncbi:hypothetical protein EON65_34745 [archaeon]|nr:MAG: hypothetical protein EON65_34745 [archaeon]